MKYFDYHFPHFKIIINIFLIISLKDGERQKLDECEELLVSGV